MALVYAGILVSMIDSSMRAQPEYHLLNRQKPVAQKLRWFQACQRNTAGQQGFPVHAQCGAVRQPLEQNRWVSLLMQSLWPATEGSDFACPYALNLISHLCSLGLDWFCAIFHKKNMAWQKERYILPFQPSMSNTATSSKPTLKLNAMRLSILL